MIYAIGLDSDRTFIHFLTEATKLGRMIQAINLRAVILRGNWRLAIPDDNYSFISVADEQIFLDPKASYYCRIIDLSTVQPDISHALLWHHLIVALTAWLEHIPGIVINRPGGHVHNFSKPLHEHYLQRAGLDVPSSLTSSDGRLLAEFARQGLTIVKPVSGVRANSRLVDAAEFENFESLRGPVHLQRYVAGADIRAHIVGSSILAEYIRSDEVDYRSASKWLACAPHGLPDELATKIIATTKAFGLTFTGWDFKLDDNGRYWCLEMNPMPGYDGYDRRLDYRITEALLTVLESSDS